MASKNFLMIRQVMQSDTVRAALTAKAQDADKITDQVSARDGYTVRADVTSGTRPRGRPYARVNLPGGQEFGDYRQPRLRVLAQVAALLRNPR